MTPKNLFKVNNLPPISAVELIKLLALILLQLNYYDIVPNN